MYIKYIYIATLLTHAIQAQSVFLKAQNSGWYDQFLAPVVNSISTERKILDIGTGPGKLLELMTEKDSSLVLIGIDIDSSMIEEARKRVTSKNVQFEYQKVNQKLAFNDDEFDAVTFCSVLFLLDDVTKQFLLDEALRVLKPSGKIIVLSPSGKKSILSSILEVWQYPYKPTNWTFIVWKTFTKQTARKWQRQQWLSSYAENQNLKYNKYLSFNENATIEILTNNNSNNK